MSGHFGQFDLFNRMLGIVTEAELEMLATKSVAVAGCGGVGFTHAETLVRMGIGGIHIADPDTFAVGNMNRQFGATMETLGKGKVEVLRDRLVSINPNLRVKTFPEGVTDRTAHAFLDGVDLAVDSIDYFVMDVLGEDPRLKLYRVAREKGVPISARSPGG